MIVVSGYYGFDNLGDEAILAALCADLRSLAIDNEEIIVLSGSPERTQAQHGVRPLARQDLKGIWSALASARCLISGGGSLLQDVTSRRSIPYYLGVVELALMRSVPVIMYGQGLGPVQSKVLRAWVARAFKRSTAASVRDQGSVAFLTELGVPRDKIKLTADPVFQHEMVLNPKQSRDKLLVNLRPYSAWPGQMQLWIKHLKTWQQAGYSIEFVPLGPGDEAMGRSLQAECPWLHVWPTLSLADYGQVFFGAEALISMRLHGLIFGALHDCLPIALNYDPKVEAIGTQLQIPIWEISDLADLGWQLERILDGADKHRADYRKALVKLRGAALENRDLLAQVLR